MLSWILPLLGLLPKAFDTVQGITTAISNEKIALINAKTDQERIAAQERLAALQAQRDVMLSESQRSNWNIYFRSLIALGPAVILLKIFVWDKSIGPFVGCVGKDPDSCGMFNTDSLDPNLWYVVMVVLGFYFLTEMKNKNG